MTATLGAVADTLGFSALRADHPELTGGIPCQVRLRRREDGSVGWSVVEPR